MGTTDWTRLWDIFYHAVDLPVEERDAYLDKATAEEPELRLEIEALLAAHADEASANGINGGIEAIRQLDPAAMVGRSIGPYRLSEVIGEGGMGVVYAAEQTEPIRRRVALKLIKLGMDTREVIARFEAERQALALMTHPNIAQVLDAGATDDGRPYFVMEYVPGLPITEYCDRNRLTLRQRIELFIRVCDAVQHAHQKGIIHRDIKPSNVLVVIQDHQPQPKIIDFGVAKAVTQPLTLKTLHTQLGRFIGTPSYISPEQAEMGALDLDTRADIYSLGVLLYELVVDSRPFDALDIDSESPLNIPRILREVDPPKPSDTLIGQDAEIEEIAANRSVTIDRLRRLVHGDLDWIILKALEHDRTRRYATADEFGKDLQRFFAHEPVIAHSPSVAYRMRKFMGRHRLGVTAAAIVALALVVGVAGLTTGLVKARKAQFEAEQERNVAEAVSDFLESILQGASPWVAQGAETELLVKMLQDAANRVEMEFGDQPRLAASLHATISDSYRELGMYDQAVHHARLELSHIEASEYGPDSEQALAAMNNLALALWSNGRLEESLELNQEVLAKQKELLGESHLDTMTTMNNVGIALKALGRYEEAEELYLDLIDRRSAVIGTAHRSTLITRNNLSNLYREWGRLEDAETHMREVVEDSKRALGPNDPDTLIFTDSYANILVKLGRVDEAETLHLDVLERMREVVGEDHPETMGAIFHLGQLYMAKGDYGRAETHFRTAYDSVSANLGKRHRYSNLALSWLARSLMLQDRWTEAEPLLREAIAVSMQIYPSGHRQTWILECRLGATLVELDRIESGRSLLQGCVPRLTRELGEDDVRSREAREYLDRTASS